MHLARAAIAAVVLAVVVAMTSASAFADRIRVPQDYLTIQEAVNVAQPGDEIVVKGLQTTAVSIVAKSQLTIRGVGARVETVGAEEPFFVDSCTDITITGFSVRNPSDHGIAVSNSTGVRVSKCKTFATSGAGIYFVNVVGGTIEKCKLSDAESEAIYLIADGPEDGMADVIVRKNLFVRCGYPLDVEGVRHQITGNRIVDSLDTGIWLTNGASQCTVSGNTITDSAKTGIHLDGTDNVVERNVVRGASTIGGILVFGTNNLVRRCKVSGTSPGIETWPASSACTLEENKVTGAAGVGIRADGDRHKVLGNVVLRPGNEGLVVVGTGGHLVERNAVDHAGYHGISIAADGVSCNLNTVLFCVGNGIHVNGNLCSIAANRVAHAGAYGFAAVQGGSNFNGNKSTKSALGGFQDAPGGGNVVQGNDFR